MRILKGILIVVLVLVALLVLIGFLLPSSVHVERSTSIDAPQSTVFALVNGFQGFNKWSPWHERDPNTQYTFEGPDFGVDAKLSWNSANPDVGVGSQRIMESEPYSKIKVSLDFGPQGVADAFYLLSREGSSTKITWGFDTEFGNDLMGRYMGLFFDSMIGPDYEKGLAGLKRYAESLPKADWSDVEIEITEVMPSTIAYASGSSTADAEEIGQALGEAYGKVTQFLRRNRIEQKGAPLSIAISYDENAYNFDAGIPIGDLPESGVRPDPNVKIGKTYSGKVVMAAHIGPYGALPKTYDKILAFIAAHGLEPGERPWDQYVSDPGDTAEEALITNIYFPVK
jgi:effector-binding domain-containing protein